MAGRDAWADAFYEQARSDWALFRELNERGDVPRCHALHYLQMATEKLAKAHRLRDTTVADDVLLSTHAGFSAFLAAFLHSPALHREFRGRSAYLGAARRGCGHLARLVEQLSPAVGGPGHPVNTEYPWAAGDAVVAPAAYGFPSIDLRGSHYARLLLNFVQLAFDDYAGGAGLRSGTRGSSG